MANLLAVSLNPNGTLKPGALNDPSQIADHFISAVKLASDALSHKSGDIKPTCDSVTPYSTAEDQGWLECNGATVSRTVFANLFAVLGTTFGPGDGVNTFTLPDLRRRTIVGSGGTATAVLGNTVGSAGGAETHTLISDELPAHTHDVYTTHYEYQAAGASNGAAVTNFYGYGVREDAIPSSGGADKSHNNLQPSLVLRFLIKT